MVAIREMHQMNVGVDQTWDQELTAAFRIWRRPEIAAEAPTALILSPSMTTVWGGSMPAFTASKTDTFEMVDRRRRRSSRSIVDDGQCRERRVSEQSYVEALINHAAPW